MVCEKVSWFVCMGCGMGDCALGVGRVEMGIRTSSYLVRSVLFSFLSHTSITANVLPQKRGRQGGEVAEFDIPSFQP